MSIIIDRRAAAVDANGSGFERFEIAGGSGPCIENLDGHRATLVTGLMPDSAAPNKGHDNIHTLFRLVGQGLAGYKEQAVRGYMTPSID